MRDVLVKLKGRCGRMLPWRVIMLYIGKKATAALIFRYRHRRQLSPNMLRSI